MVTSDDAEETINFICKNKKNVSHIQDYLLKLEQGKGKDILTNIPILTGVFSFYTRKKTWQGVNEDIELDISPSSETFCDNDDSNSSDKKKAEMAQKKVNLWLYNSYKSYIKLLLSFFTHKIEAVRIKSIEALFEIIEVEYSTNIKESSAKGSSKLNFPNSIYIKIIRQVLVTDGLSQKVTDYLNTLFDEYDDLSFYCLKDIHSLLENQKITQKYPDALECISKNTYEILMMITNRNSDLKDDVSLYVDVDDVEMDTTEIQKAYKHVYSSAWMALLHLPSQPVVIQKKVLLNLDTKIMPQLTDPKLLIDFLTDCYDAGGVTSLLALNGLFVLINQYNLDYPEFYTKLYMILEANIFQTKYKSRFFYLLDLFLTSTHLPAYLVMAFVKKLTRIALFTPGEDLFMLLKFIKNLLIRHPSSRILVHRQSENDTVKSIPEDPFMYNVDDPYKSNASKSCLWELESLKSHYSKDVLKLLQSFRKEFPLVEDDITEYFDQNFESMISSRLDEEVQDGKLPAFNFEKRSEIFSFDSDMWCI